MTDVVYIKKKTGRWVRVFEAGGLTSALECSACGFRDYHFEFFHYCPKCGAQMMGNKKRHDLDALKEEVKDCIVHSPYFHTTSDCCHVRDDVMLIFDRHIAEMEEDEDEG